MAKKVAKKPATAPRVKSTKVVEAKPTAVKTRTVTKSAAKSSAFTKYFELRRFRTLSVSAIVAELLGTFTLVLVYMTVQGSQLFLFFAYAALVLVFARVAGPHLNPAITVGLWAVRRISGLKAVSLVIAQVIGAMLALVVATALVPDTANQLTGQPEAGQVFQATALPTESEALWRTLSIEAIGSFILAFGAAAAFLTQRSHTAKAFTLGGAYLLGLLVFQGGQILNPAIALGVQAVKWDVWALSIYVLVPLAATVVSMSLYKFMQRETLGTEDSDVQQPASL